MSAIVKVGGSQLTINEGDRVKVEKIDAPAGQTVEFGEVLAIMNGDSFVFGKPLVEGAKVEAKILKHGKDRKIIVFKYKPKKRYRKTQGHRQNYTEIEISKIIKG